MQAARSPLRKALYKIAIGIDRARRSGFDPSYQNGVRAVAESIAEDIVVPSERASFFLACGIDSNAKND